MCFSSIFFFTSFLIILNLCHSKDDFRIELDYIVVADDSSAFQQKVDTSGQDHADLSVCPSYSDIFCVQWKTYALFNVTQKNECKFFNYKSTSAKQLKVAFNLTKIHIYGGAEADVQKWPVESSPYNVFPFVSTENNSQAVLEPFWIFSTGHYLYVDNKVPLFISVNKTQNKFEIIAQNQHPYLNANQTILKYRICQLGDMKKAYLHAVNNVLGKPRKIMDSTMVQKPIWSTWVKFKENITEKIVTDYVGKIKSHEFPISHVEIDDKWETCYGSLTVDPARFPDMKTMVKNFKKSGFKTTLWVHPFINIDCHPHYEEAVKNDYFVKNSNGTRVVWWNGDAGYIDFTNANASKWYQKRLEKLKANTGVDSFKFDAGESSWSPENPIFNVIDATYPETILKSYVKMASNFGNMVEVRVGRGTQQYPVFVRMLDRDSKWDGPKGLSTLIPTLLQMNIIGYPFVLPDMIGGNQYNGEVISEELFVRWLQANVFMPTLQFSVPPWDFGGKTIQIAAQMMKLHKSYANEITHLMKISTKFGIPVNLPLWWVDPNDTTTHTIDNEFMLGSDILVAPVLTENATQRDIYLPKGVWRDENNKKSKFIAGPKWLYNYSAGIETLPYFQKMANYSGGIVVTPSLLLSLVSLFFIL